MQEIFKFEKLRIGKFTLAGLTPKGKVLMHTDSSPNLRSTHRMHIPIITNPDVEVYIGFKKFYMEEGMIYEFNNTFPHWVDNNSDEMRVHAIFDVVDEDIYKDKFKKITEYIKVGENQLSNKFINN